MWKDTTSCAKGQRGEKEPTSWSTEVNELRITVTCGHIDWGGKWIMHCPTMNMREVELVGCEGANEAKLRAVVLVKDRLKHLSKLADAVEI